MSLVATNTTNSNTQTEPKLPEIHKDYLWLLTFDLIIFAFLAYLSYTSSKKDQNKLKVDYNEFKTKFQQALIFSNGSRAFSLIIIIFISNRTGNSIVAWCNYFFHTIPAFLFVNAYIYMIIFFAEQYNSFSRYQNHFTKPALLLVSYSSFIVVVVLALFTLCIYKN
jgi:hypothetical protein